MALKQEVMRDCAIAFDHINFVYFELILTRITDLDTQWKLDHHLHPHTAYLKCNVCGQQSHMMDQHDSSRQHQPDNNGNTCTSQASPHMSNRSPDQNNNNTVHTNLAEETTTLATPENDTISDEEVFAMIAKVTSETACDIDTYNTDELFLCVSMISLSPLLLVSTHFLDIMNEEAYSQIPLNL